jgi:hypothetical protein
MGGELISLIESLSYDFNLPIGAFIKCIPRLQPPENRTLRSVVAVKHCFGWIPVHILVNHLKALKQIRVIVFVSYSHRCSIFK